MNPGERPRPGFTRRDWGDGVVTYRQSNDGWGHGRYVVFLRDDDGLLSRTDWFIDQERHGDRTWGLFLAGAHPSGCALTVARHQTLTAAVGELKTQLTREEVST